MAEDTLQALCSKGQIQLMETLYLDAAATLALAEQQAWDSRDFDTLSRLYLPLQEARRQIRQRCGEGAVRLHCFPKNQAQAVSPLSLVESCSMGQMLVGGWGTIAPAVEVRRLAVEKSLYLETFLGAVYPLKDALVVVIAPLPDTSLPPLHTTMRTQFEALLPDRCLILTEADIASDVPAGTAESFASVMSIWERLHLPFLKAAMSEPDPVKRMELYRLTLQVDPACELAHQFLADIARAIARRPS